MRHGTCHLEWVEQLFRSTWFGEAPPLNIKCVQQFVKVGGPKSRHLRSTESINVEDE